MLEEFPGITPYHIDDALAGFLGFDNADALTAAFEHGDGTVVVPELYPERFNLRLRELPNYPWINPREDKSAPSNQGKRTPSLDGAKRCVRALQDLLGDD